MKKNVGGIDRALRIIAGIALLSLTVIGPKTLWGLVGIVPILTGSLSFCPFYPLLGLNTCPLEEKNKLRNKQKKGPEIWPSLFLIHHI